MRRLGHILFFTAAFAACMTVITKVRADNNTVEIRALAVCKDGKCVMAEEDYKQLQAFVVEVRKAIEANEKTDELADTLREGLLARLARCRASEHRHIGERQ